MLTHGPTVVPVIQMHGTMSGLAGPRRSDVTLSKNSDGTCSYCENYADGYDADRDESVCERCADILDDEEGR